MASSQQRQNIPAASTLRAAIQRDGFVLVPLLSAQELRVIRAAAERHAAAVLADPLGRQAAVNKMATLTVRTNPADGVAYAEHVPRLDLFGCPELQELLAVSYTHLTLPTIYSV